MPRTRPPIKNGVDLQLQSACSEGNWLVALRLAEKRIRISKDPYYETLKICAESQLDDPSTRFAAVTAAWQYVKDGTTIKDVDALDLLEWACQDHLPEGDFAETLGMLRMRAVKAGVKNQHEAIRCLESCLLHWDLVNAQQIAATMDRSYPQERKFMFWNIAITHMLSMNEQAPPEKKTLYGMLAQKQIERAAQASESDDSESKGAKSTARTVQSEEEILLLYDVVEKHGSSKDIAKLIESPVLGPVPQFRKGRKELLMRTLRRQKQAQDWRAVFDLCRNCLTNGDEKDPQPEFLAADWSVWQQFIEAASHLESVDTTASTTVQELLIQFAKSPSLRPIYRRNVLLARLAAVFTFSKPGGPDAKDSQPSSLRLKELVSYLKDQYPNSACFNDVKSFIEKLDDAGLLWLATSLKDYLQSSANDERASNSIELLSLKTRYIVSTSCLTDVVTASDKVSRVCKHCKAETSTTLCRGCLAAISSDALSKYQELRTSSQSHQSGTSSELAILAALCEIDMADLRTDSPSLSPVSIPSLYRALAILEEQLVESPKDSVMLLILVQLHLRIGSAHRARLLWDGLGVKRTIVDCIAPVLYDRLSSVAPALLSRSDRRGYELAECVSSHYDVSLKQPMPRRLLDAFEAESYGSILQIPTYIENLRTGCTRVMSLVEEARTARLIEGPGGRILDDPRYGEIQGDLKLCETIDFGSYPAWARSERQPVYSQLQLGPSPTNARSHLSLQAETFHEVLSYRAPPVYKSATGTDPVFVLEHMSRIGNSLSTFLAVGDDSSVTSEEAIYFNLLSVLSGLILLSTCLDRPAAEETLPALIESAKTALGSLQGVLSSSGGTEAEEATVNLSNLHGLTILRDSAVATRLICQWILAHNEKEKERDRSGQSGLPKDVVAQVKHMQTAAESSSKFGKTWLSTLQSQVGGADFRKHIQAQLSGDQLSGLDTSRTLDHVIASWKATLKGWQDVRWE